MPARLPKQQSGPRTRSKWLRYGPGRERPGEPGWTDSAQLSGPECGPVAEPVYVAVWGNDGGGEGDPEVLEPLGDAEDTNRRRLP